MEIVEGWWMEEVIKNLDERTDPATKEMLQKVVNKKKKFDRNKARHIYSIWSTMLLITVYLVYLNMTVMEHSINFAAMFSSYVEDSINLYFLIFTVGSFGLMNLLKEKREKAEKEYHDLRCEIIDRSKDLWKKEDEWKNRHIVFEMMKQHFDINLYHESK